MAQRVIEYHIGRLKSKQAPVRLDAVQQLLLLKADVPVDTFVEAFKSEDDPGVLNAIRQHLTEYYMPRLKATSEEIRREAIARLLEIEAVDALQALQDVHQNDVSDAIRKEAVRVGRLLWDVRRKQQQSG